MPLPILNNAPTQIRGSELFDYLCYAYDAAISSKMVIESDKYAIFNTGIRDRSDIYAYFELNSDKPDKQKWRLVSLETADMLRRRGVEEMPDAACELTEYQCDINAFACCYQEKYNYIAKYFDGDGNRAREHVEQVFMHSHQLGYIMYENEQAVFDIGVETEKGQTLYALFAKNRNKVQEWFLVGFFDKPKGITRLPDCVLDTEIETKRHDTQPKDGGTLLVTAIPVEYEALQEVLQENDIKYAERTETGIGNREFRYIYIEKLNTYALLSGQSFECIIPIIQSILAFRPAQAVLSGIAFSFDMTKAPYNSIVVSKSVFDYESAKINEDEKRQRGNKLPSSINLRQLFTESLAKGVVIKSGDYASGMKVVNSLQYQQEIKATMPELLAGDEEGFFFAHSCNEFKIDWIVIKAISDYGVGKTDDIQKIAAYSALDYTIRGLRQQASVQ